MRRAASLAVLAAFALTACAAGNAGTPDTPEQPPEQPTPAAAPWDSPPLLASSVPQELLTAWSRAENRSSCAPLAFDPAVVRADATPRIATFGGGWGIAYDLPDQRSAFGVAGTGVRAAEPSYDEWPNRRTWADGSTVGYGPEGGSGPNQLAYLRVAGQGCLYNVWSRLGQAHLETLLESLRRIATP